MEARRQQRQQRALPRRRNVDEGIVPTAEVTAAVGVPAQSPDLPGWVAAWIAADADRAWPPEKAAA